MRKKQQQITLAVIWFLICTVLLTLPGSSLPSSKWWNRIPMFDKWVHIILFLILTYLICLPWKNESRSKNKNRVYWLSLSCFLYGILMELVQHFFIPLRSFDMGDIAADGAGVVVGLLILKAPAKN